MVALFHARVQKGHLVAKKGHLVTKTRQLLRLPRQQNTATAPDHFRRLQLAME